MSDGCTKVPTFIPGYVISELGPSTCNDGAKYQFSSSGPIGLLWRVRPTNDAADKALAEALRTHDEVVIGGFICKGPEPGCVRFDCYVVQDAATFTEKAANF